MLLYTTNMIKEKIKQYIPKSAKIEFYDNSAIFEIPVSQIKEAAGELHGNTNLSLKLITATDEREENGCFKIWYVFAAPGDNIFIIPFIQLKNTTKFPSLTSVTHEAWNYERIIQTFFGLIPVGHPDSRPITLHENWPANVFPLRKDFDWKTRPKEAHGEYQLGLGISEEINAALVGGFCKVGSEDAPCVDSAEAKLD